jgi:septal ring factor EnvC (AmiA/AmiB activator)
MLNWVKNNSTISTLMFGLFSAMFFFYISVQVGFAQLILQVDSNERSIKKIDDQPSLNTHKINQLNININDVKTDLNKFKDQYEKDREKIIDLLIEIKRK